MAPKNATWMIGALVLGIASASTFAAGTKPFVVTSTRALPEVAYIILGSDFSRYPACETLKNSEADDLCYVDISHKSTEEVQACLNRNPKRTCSFGIYGDSAQLTNFPSWVREAPHVRIKAGKIESVYAITKGIDVQDERYQTLVAVYGKPTHVKRTAVQNRFGATFQKIDADWSLPWGGISFEGIGKNLDEGSILGFINDAAIPAVTAYLADHAEILPEPKKATGETNTTPVAQARVKLGIQYSPMIEQAAVSLKLPRVQGVFIQSTEPTGVASHNGLSKGDTILKVGTQTIEATIPSFSAALSDIVPGSTVPFTIWRNGQEQTIDIHF